MGIARQWSREKFVILSLKPRSNFRIWCYRTWGIVQLTRLVNKATTTFHGLYSYRPYKRRQNVQNPQVEPLAAAARRVVSQKITRAREREKEIAPPWRHFNGLYPYRTSLSANQRSRNLSIIVTKEHCKCFVPRSNSSKEPMDSKWIHPLWRRASVWNVMVFNITVVVD